MTRSVGFVLSYDFKNVILSPSKWTYFHNLHYVMDVVNDVKYSRKSVNTRVVINRGSYTSGHFI